jgi:plastocyanin
MRIPTRILTAAALVLAGTGCSGGGSGSSAMAPSNGDTPSSSSATITISASGVSPKTVTISAGGQVTFINNDNQTHNMQSDPHPEHTDCPELASVGFLTPGQSRNTGNLNTKRTCGYHDHDNFANQKLQGSIVIQ